MQILENCGWHIAFKCTPDGLKWNQSLENQCEVWEGRPSASASPPPPHFQRPALCVVTRNPSKDPRTCHQAVTTWQSCDDMAKQKHCLQLESGGFIR